MNWTSRLANCELRGPAADASLGRDDNLGLHGLLFWAVLVLDLT